MSGKNSDAKWQLKQLSSQFLVKDLGKTIDFYTEQLGFTIAFRYEDFYCSLVKNNWSINFKLTEQPLNISFLHNHNDEDDIDVHLVFSIDNIEDVWQEIKSRTVTIIQSLRKMPYGHEFYISDPDGYRIVFIEAK
ncbi:MAG: VOC family protein [Chitinophagaceae bacterium]